MSRLAILLDSRFEKSLPKERQQQILEQVSQFARDYVEYKNQKERLLKYGIDKVEGCTKLKEVWKFKVSKGERILFIKGKDVEWDTYEYENALIFLAFCDHDAQIRRARSMSTVGKVIDIDDFTDEVARELDYEPETAITHVFKNIDITSLVHSENLTGIYYLNKEQRHFVNQDLRPLVLFGSAGSGKTTIGIYKVFALLKQDPNLKIGYFTYSNHLLKTAQNIFETVVANEIISEETLNEKGLKFYNIREFLMEKTKVKQLVELDHFRVFYRSQVTNPRFQKLIRRVEAFDAWREVRGIIKGFAGIEWNPDSSQRLLDEEKYLGLKSTYTSFEQEDKVLMYEIAKKYIEWLDKEGLYDENDLSRMLLNQIDHVPQFDWIVIDEVQDLTEIEIYLMYSMARSKDHVLISGDFYQTINPTFFDTRRISTLLGLSGEKYEQYPQLAINYRNPKIIVEAANRLSDYRQRLFGRDRRNDLGYEKPMQDIKGQVYILSNNHVEKIKLLKEALEKAYVYIVVPTEAEKEKLMGELETTSRIFTIAEVKGIENECIICVNMFTAYQEKWEIIRREERLKESIFYKYLLNMLYVAMTRAKNYVCFVDDVVDMELYNLFFQEKMICEAFDPVVFHFEKASTEEDFYRYAYKLEEMENYEAAMREYESLTLREAKLGVKRCQAALMKRDGNHLEAAALYEEIGSYREAIVCYSLIGEEERCFKLMLQYDKKAFLKEIIQNEDKDYERDIKPYLSSKEVRDAVEDLCLKYYSLKLEDITPYKDFEIDEVSSLTKEMKEINKRMEGFLDGR